MEIYEQKTRVCFAEAQSYLECYYQPVYNIGKGRIDAAEALLRYNDGKHPDIERVIRAAEQYREIASFDLWMLEEVLKKLPLLKERGVERINVNLSPVTCSQEGLEKKVFGLLEQYGADPANICFEITETQCVEANIGFLSRLTDSLMKHGLKVAIDDFGKEESNLLRIMKIPFSILKLDKEVIRSLNDSELSKSMVESIVQFFHRYEIGITAEGIETYQQARALTLIGCDNLQGYLFSKPLPLQEFCAFLDGRGAPPALTKRFSRLGGGRRTIAPRRSGR